MGSYFKFRFALAFVALLIMGLIFSVSGSVNNAKAADTNLDFNYMSKYEFKKGMYVKGQVFEIYDEYAYEETYEEKFGVKTNKRVSSHYYIVPMTGTFESEIPMYITVEIGNGHTEMLKNAELLMQQTWDFIDYNIEPEKWNEFDIVGKVSPLDAELEGYLYEWFMYGDVGATRADYEPYICPWVITYHNAENQSTVIIIGVVMAVIGAVGLAIMITLFIKNRNTPVPVSRAPYSPPGAYGSYSSNLTDRDFDYQPPNSSNQGYSSYQTTMSQTSGEMGYANSQTGGQMESVTPPSRAAQPSANTENFSAPARNEVPASLYNETASTTSVSGTDNDSI